MTLEEQAEAARQAREAHRREMDAALVASALALGLAVPTRFRQEAVDKALDILEVVGVEDLTDAQRQRLPAILDV